MFGFEGTETGELEQFFKNEVKFAFREMFVEGDKVVLIGNGTIRPTTLDTNNDGFITPIDGLHHRHTVVMTVTPSENKVVVQEFEGFLSQLSFAGNLFCRNMIATIATLSFRWWSFG